MKILILSILALFATTICYGQTTSSLLASGLDKLKHQDEEGAIADYTKAIAIDPKLAKAFVYRAIAKRQQANQTDAIADLNKAIDLNPTFSDAFFARGNCKGDLGDGRGAIQDYSKAIEYSTVPQKDFFYERGECKAKLRDYNGAIDDFSKAIEIDPNFAYAYAGRADAKIKLGQKESGCLDYSKSGELGHSAAYFLIEINCQ